MSASYVSLVLDLYDGQGSRLRSGRALIRPSAPLTDVPGMQVVPPAPAAADFRPGITPVVTLLASDNPGPQPSGWTWGIEFTVPGGLPPWSFFAPAGPVSFTVTGADPAVLTWAPGTEAWQVRSLPDGTGVQLSGGSLPPGLAAGATYYVTGSAGCTLQLAACPGGPPLGSLSPGSGELTVTLWRLSALTPVQPAARMGGYLPVPSGTPAPGEVPVAQDGSTATAWGGPFVPVAGDQMDGPLSPAVNGLEFAATVPVNAALGNVFSLVMTGPCTLASPVGGLDGQTLRLRVTSNGHALGYGAAYQFGTAGEPPLSSSGMDVLGFEYIAPLQAWTFMGGGGQGFS